MQQREQREIKVNKKDHISKNERITLKKIREKEFYKKG